MKHITLEKYLLLTFFSLIISLQGIAQPMGNMIFGRVVDKKTNQGLPGTIIQLNQEGGTAKFNTATDGEGRFRLADLPNGTFKFIASSIGYDVFDTTVTFTGSPIRMRRIGLSEKSLQSKEVVIENKIPLVIQKNDTSEYNANAYKVNKDASTEDLVGKMPGIQMQNGKINAQGEEVKQVLVDGKPFFGDDVNAALRNLPAEVVDKIQVFDQKSDQSQFTGFNDGNTTKTMNIVTKESKRNGRFGKFYAGGGVTDVYQAGGSLNQFKGSQRLSVVLQSNNINQQNFSFADLLGVMGGGSGSGGMGGGRRMMMGGAGGGGGSRGGGMGGGDISDFMVSNQDGITETQAVGLNFTDSYLANKLDLSASYFFNYSDNNARQNTFRKFYNAADTGQIYRENLGNLSSNMNHRFNMRLNYKIDSNNRLMIRPRLTFQKNEGSSLTAGNTFNPERVFSNTGNDYRSNLDGVSFSNEILYTHRFPKTKSTVTVGGTGSYNQNVGDYSSFQTNSFMIANRYDTVDQKADLNRDGWNWNANATFTQPISKVVQMSLSQNYNYQKNHSEKYTYRNQANGAQRTLDTALSNLFDNTYIAHQTSVGMVYNKNKANLTVNLAYQTATLNNDQVFPQNLPFKRDFVNVLPTALLQYKVSDSKNLRINYRTSVNVPQVSQMQNVVNNTNPLQLSTGNPALKQSFQQNLFAIYNSSNVEKASTFFAVAGGSFQTDYIGNSTLIARTPTMVDGGFVLQPGAQFTRPVNLGGYASARSFVSYGVPIKKIKSNLNIMGGGTYSRVPSLINDRINYSQQPNGSLTASLSSNINEKVDFSFSATSAYNRIINSLNKNQNTTNLNHSIRGRVNFILPQNFVITSDAAQTINTGLTGGFNANFFIWNAAVGKKFLNDRADIRLYVFDILGQNQAVRRTNSDVYYEDVISNTLTRYYMLTFTWTIRSFGGAAPAEGMKGGGPMMMMPMGRPPGGAPVGPR